LKPLPLPYLHDLRAAVGWLELGNPLEANAELEDITPELRAHPDVLEIRWQIYAKESKWDARQDIARAMTKTAPERVTGWLDLSYSDRRATGGSVQAAWETLLAVGGKFPEEWAVPYNLACYACQLGKQTEAWDWLEKAFDIGDPKQLKLMALDDKDLEPFWVEISEI
jgi:hypothetical protein